MGWNAWQWDRTERREWGWLLALPPQGGLGFPEVHGLKCLAAWQNRKKRMEMATGTPPTRGTWFPRGPRAEVPGSGDRTEGRGYSGGMGHDCWHFPHKGDLYPNVFLMQVHSHFYHYSERVCIPIFLEEVRRSGACLDDPLQQELLFQLGRNCLF